MNNYELAADEVILYENYVMRDNFQDSSKMILTSKKMIFEKTKTSKAGLFKTKTETIIADTVMLETIKLYNGKVQIQQKSSDVYIQTTEKNFTIKFDGIMEARKFVTKITDAITGTTIFKRGTEKVKKTLDTVDDVLGFKTRDTIKGVIENGVVVSLLNGIKKKKK